MTFANPLAFWALLGIPAVLAIHFLQRKSRREVITTLFLLQQMRRESETGNRIERLRPSIPLWLQLLMVLIFTWLLAGPRWMKQDAVYRIAIVLDTSASMQAFRPAAEQGVRQILGALLGPASKAELTLLSSDPEAASLYHGTSAMDLLGSLAAWEPLLGVHDFTPALRTGRSLAGLKGAVVLVTDHPHETKLPFDAKHLSIGQETANVGWAGVTVEEKDGQTLWRALVRNHGKTAQEREWHAEHAGKTSALTKLSLGPGESRTLSGPFLEGSQEAGLSLVLTADSFTLDDRLPVLQPKPKVVGLNVPAPSNQAARELGELFQRFADTEQVAAAIADVRVLVWPPSVALEDTQHACAFASPTKVPNAPFLSGPVVGEAHPLVEGLNWQSLLVREGMVMPRDSRDRVLVWQGDRPLVSLRITPAGARQLFCHFDLATSNARKLPALAVLLHRFLEEVRHEKVFLEAANYDVRQRLTVAHARGDKAPPLDLVTHTPAGKTSVPLGQVHLLRAPVQPGFFEVMQGENLLVRGTAHFADTREADLSAAKPFDETAGLAAAQVETTHEADPNWRLWFLVLLTALLGSWWWSRGAANTPVRSKAIPA